MANESTLISRFEEVELKLADLKEDLIGHAKDIPAEFRTFLSMETIEKAKDVKVVEAKLRTIQMRINALVQACKLEEKMRELANALDNESIDMTVRMKANARDRRAAKREKLKNFKKMREEEMEDTDGVLAKKANTALVLDKAGASGSDK
jgi:transcriptional regulator with GAF, ATPase, and Fis domain